MALSRCSKPVWSAPRARVRAGPCLLPAAHGRDVAGVATAPPRPSLLPALRPSAQALGCFGVTLGRVLPPHRAQGSGDRLWTLYLYLSRGRFPSRAFLKTVWVSAGPRIPGAGVGPLLEAEAQRSALPAAIAPRPAGRATRRGPRRLLGPTPGRPPGSVSGPRAPPRGAHFETGPALAPLLCPPLRGSEVGTLTAQVRLGSRRGHRRRPGRKSLSRFHRAGRAGASAKARRCGGHPHPRSPSALRRGAAGATRTPKSVCTEARRCGGHPRPRGPSALRRARGPCRAGPPAPAPPPSRARGPGSLSSRAGCPGASAHGPTARSALHTHLRPRLPLDSGPQPGLVQARPGP